ncbi:MAG: DUF3014 domain-containing protein [Pseudomonadales bacterium]|jgi:hypothetical protein|nr:DUF3014 domain-containing protein [Pseudomonadales bacterium]
MAPRYWIVVLAVIIAVVAGVMFFSDPDEVPEERRIELAPAPAEPDPEPEAMPEPEPVVVPEPAPEPEPIVLPALDDSDEFLREQAEVLSSDGSLSWLLATEELVRKFTVVIENMAEGGMPRDPVAFLAPREAFSVVQRGGRTYLNPESYDRFDRITGVLETIEASQAVALLRLIEPLMADAYAELGVREPDVDGRIVAAIDVLLATPEVSGPIELAQPSVMYEFADPELEALAPAQKQLLRMGPANGARLRAKLQELRALLAED